MATAYVTFGLVEQPAVFGSGRSEAVTTSGTSTATTLTAGNEEVAQIYCATGVYARCGGTVTAASGLYCPPGLASYLRTTPGKTISLIDA